MKAEERLSKAVRKVKALQRKVSQIGGFHKLQRPENAKLRTSLRAAQHSHEAMINRYNNLAPVASTDFGPNGELIPFLNAPCALSPVISDKLARGGSETVVPKYYRYSACLMRNVTQIEYRPNAWEAAEHAAKNPPRASSVESVEVGAEGSVEGRGGGGGNGEYPMAGWFQPEEDADWAPFTLLGIWSGKYFHSDSAVVGNTSMRGVTWESVMQSRRRWLGEGEGETSSAESSGVAWSLSGRSPLRPFFHNLIQTENGLPRAFIPPGQGEASTQTVPSSRDVDLSIPEWWAAAAFDVGDKVGPLRLWDQEAWEGLTLRYAGGDPCGSKEREVFVHLVCAGAETRIVHMAENGVCSYHLAMGIPLACSDTRARTLERLAGQVSL